MNIRAALRLGLQTSLQAALGLTLAITGTLHVRAAEPTPAPIMAPKLTLGQAVQMGLERQPAIQAARASLNSSSIARDAAYAPASALGGRVVSVRRQQADFGVSIAHAGVEAAELDTIHAVTRVYLSALYADEQVKVAQEALTNLKVVHDAAKTLVNAGSKNVFADDVERIATYMLIAEAKLNEARLGHARAVAGVREAIGVEPGCPVELGGESLGKYYEVAIKHIGTHGAISCRCAVELALQHRPEVAMAAMLSEISHLEIRAQSMSFHPYSKTFAATADIHSKVLPATLINGEYRPGALAPEMPVFMAGSTSSRQCRAAALADRAMAVSEKTRNLISLETEEACIRLNEYAAQVVLLSRATTQSFKVSEDARRAYRNDQMGTDRMLTAQVIEAQNKAAANEATFKFAIALAALQHGTAGHLWDCIEKPASAPAQSEKLGKVPMPKVN